MKDLMNDIDLKVALAPVVVADNTVQTGATIDRRGFGSLTFAIATGTLADADATFAVSVEAGDASDASDFAAVTSADELIGTAALASFDFSADVKCRKIGYRGPKRYARIKITPANNAGNAPISAVAILGHPYQRPTANPPA